MSFLCLLFLSCLFCFFFVSNRLYPRVYILLLIVCTMHVYTFSIYTLSDLGDLSDLIGSLSRTIQQYSPLSEWIMCELGFFFPFS